MEKEEQENESTKMKEKEVKEKKRTKKGWKRNKKKKGGKGGKRKRKEKDEREGSKEKKRRIQQKSIFILQVDGILCCDATCTVVKKARKHVKQLECSLPGLRWPHTAFCRGCTRYTYLKLLPIDCKSLATYFWINSTLIPGAFSPK